MPSNCAQTMTVSVMQNFANVLHNLVSVQDFLWKSWCYATENMYSSFLETCSSIYDEINI